MGGRDSRLRGNDVGGCGNDVGGDSRLRGNDVGGGELLIADWGLLIADWGLLIADWGLHDVSLGCGLVGLWEGVRE